MNKGRLEAFTDAAAAAIMAPAFVCARSGPYLAGLLSAAMIARICARRRAAGRTELARACTL